PYPPRSPPVCRSYCIFRVLCRRPRSTLFPYTTLFRSGVSGVHTNMTNTRLTDPEVLETRFPVVLEEFCVRRGSGGRGQWNAGDGDRKSTRLNSSHVSISYAVFCLKKKTTPDARPYASV